MRRWQGKTDLSPLLGRRRGSVYLAVLATATFVTVVGLSSVLLGRVRLRMAEGSHDAVRATFWAQSAVEVALARLDANPNWRTTYTHDVWTADFPAGEATCRFKLVDEVDTDLANNSLHALRVYGMASVGDAVRLCSVVVQPSLPPNLLENANFENGTAGWSGVDFWGNCSVEQVTDYPHNGAACLRIYNRANQYAGPSQDVTDVIEKGVTYYAEVWVRGYSSTNDMAVGLRLNTTDGYQWFFVRQTWAGSDYTKLSGAITPTWTGTLNEAHWHIDTPNTSLAYRIDDAMLVEGDYPQSPQLSSVAGTWRRDVVATAGVPIEGEVEAAAAAQKTLK